MKREFDDAFIRYREKHKKFLKKDSLRCLNHKIEDNQLFILKTALNYGSVSVYGWY